MARGTAFVGAVARERLTQGHVSQLGLIAGQLGNVGRRSRDVLAQQPADDPVASLDRARAQAGRILGQKYRHCQQPTTPILARVVDPRPAVGSKVRLGDTVMPGQGRVDERVFGVEQIVDGTIVFDQVDEKPDGLLEHRPPQLVVEGGEPRSIDAVVLFKAAKVEPVAAKFGRQATDSVVSEHAPSFGQQHWGLMKLAGRRSGHQCFVGHARPEEIAQPACQGVIGKRPDCGSGPREVDAITKMR